MGAPVVLVGVLVRVPVAIGPLAADALRLAQGEIVAFDGIGHDHLGTVGHDSLHPLPARVARNDQRHLDAERRPEHGVGDAGVAR